MKGELGENGYTYMYSWMPSLFTCYHNIINWLSVQFSHSVMSDSLWPRGLQHARPLCPSPTPRASNPILSSVIPFPSCLQSFPASGSFPKSQFSASGGQSIRASASISIEVLTSDLSINIQDWFPLGWTGWISLQSKGLPRVFSNTTVKKHQFFGAQPSLWSNSHIHTWPLEKPQLWLCDLWNLVSRRQIERDVAVIYVKECSAYVSL